MSRYDIRILDAAAAREAIDDLAALMVDAVAHNASVNYMAGLTLAQARPFWERVAEDVAEGSRVLLVADAGADGARWIAGTVQLILAPQPNQPFRADIGKMIVHSSARGRGIGQALLLATETEAMMRGRTLLTLDTETGSAGERLYRRCGWTEYGVVPGYAYAPDGRLASATFFYKKIAQTRAWR